MSAFAPSLPLVADTLHFMFKPPEQVAVHAWASHTIVAPDGPRAGHFWDPGLTPYVPEILDVLAADSDAELWNHIVVRKSVQVGLSVMGIIWVAFLASQEANVHIGYALPTLDVLRNFNRDKMQPVLEQSPVLARLLKPIIARSSQGSTQSTKDFANRSKIHLINANSAVQLRVRTFKYGVADEVDGWDEDLADEGSAFRLFEGRFTSFHATRDWRILEISTPTIAGASRITASFEAGDQRFWHVRCPHCDSEFVFEFKHLKFNRRPPYEAHYVAQCCGSIIQHHEKGDLVRNGRFIALNPEGVWPSFHIDALSSLITTWDDVARQWWQDYQTDAGRKTFWNNVLGLAYEVRGDAPDHQRLMERREDYRENHIPPKGLLLVAGADIQHRGIWVEIVAYGADRQSWTVSARYLEGETTDHERGAFALLDGVYTEKFADAFGGVREIDAMAIDAGDATGGRANQVYSFARSRSRAFAVKGMPGWTTPAIGTPTPVDISLRGKKLKRGAMLWPVGTWGLKGEFYADLRKSGRAAGLEADPAGYCHFGAFLDENYFKQLTDEYLADEMIRGRSRRVWKEISGQNHLLDCRVYALAVADYLGLTRMTPDGWRRLAQRRSVPLDAIEGDLFAPEPIAAERAAERAAKNTKPKRSFEELAAEMQGG